MYPGTEKDSIVIRQCHRPKFGETTPKASCSCIVFGHHLTMQYINVVIPNLLLGNLMFVDSSHPFTVFEKAFSVALVFLNVHL